MDSKKHIVAVTALIKNVQGNKFLIVKRGPNEIAFANKWAFPGGKLEKGENIAQTLQREVDEEVGLQIRNAKRYLKDYTFVRPDGHNVVGLAFEVQAEHENVRLAEDFAEYAWVTPEELMNYDCIQGMNEEVKVAFR